MATKPSAVRAEYRIFLDEDETVPAISFLTGPFDFIAAGGAGNDVLTATSGRAHLSGGAGNDILSGATGGDWLVGGAGNDVLAGYDGDDRLNGDAGNDRLNGGSGNDALDGGAGWDIATYSGSVLDYSFRIFGNAGVGGNAGLITLVHDNRTHAGTDGSDSVRRVEELQFSDRSIFLDGRNNLPYAVADTLVTDEDQVLLITPATLLGNDWDFEGDALVMHSIGPASHGTLTQDSSGKILFTPAPHFSGIASFSYTISDAQGGLDAGTVQIRVNAVADAPLLTVNLADPLPGGFLHSTQTTVILETENNDSLALANQISRDIFTIASNPDLTDPRDPSVSIHGVISSAFDRDYYQFNLKVGETVIFDIDYGKPDVDTIITLFDAAGNTLAINDDYGFAHQSLDGGSISFLDSYLKYTFAQDGDYTLMVRPFRTGGDYQLNVSIDDATAQGASAQPIPLDIQAALVDTDGSETLSVVISGLPSGALLSAGTLTSDGSWALTPSQLAGLTLMLPAGTSVQNMVVDAIATESENGSTAHTIIGGAGDNLIRGGAESDILTGGGGADIFDFDHLSRAPDIITDFQSGPGGDVLDLRDLLDGAQAGQPLAQLIRMEDSANGTIVSIASLAGGAFHPVVLLQNIYGVTGQELATAGNLQLF